VRTVRRLRASLREGCALFLPPSQETGEVCSLCALVRAQDSLQAPAREGAEDTMKTTLLRSAFLSLAVGFSLQAQINSQLARVSGMLTDSSGGAIGDVQVQARLDVSANSQTWSAKSLPGGEYSLDLPAGRYRLQFTRAPFTAREFTLKVVAAESLTINLRLD